MTNEELDEARAKEAERLWERFRDGGASSSSVVAARLARENWTPPVPEPVDPDVLAFEDYAGAVGLRSFQDAYLAGARMAREREQERAKVLVEFAKSRVPLIDAADVALAKYWGKA